MKLQTLISELIVGVILLLALPYILIEANTLFGLPQIDNIFLKPLGFVFILAGGALFLYCSSLFYSVGKGTPSPIEPTENLVTTGPYAYSRNPMYLSYLIIFFGEFLLLGHMTLLIYIVLVFLFIRYFVIHYEEPDLLKKFGERYVEYQSKTPRFVGKHGNS